MDLAKGTVEKYTMRFGSGDKDLSWGKGKGKTTCGLSGGYLQVMLDLKTYTMAIEGDWGNYTYRWSNCQGGLTFKQLLVDILRDEDYMLRKLSDCSVINWPKTKKHTVECLFHCHSGAKMTKEEKSEFLNDITNFDGFTEESYSNMVLSHCPEMWEDHFIVKEYPAKAIITVKVLSTYLREALIEELKEVE